MAKTEKQFNYKRVFCVTMTVATVLIFIINSTEALLILYFIAFAILLIRDIRKKRNRNERDTETAFHYTFDGWYSDCDGGDCDCDGGD